MYTIDRGINQERIQKMNRTLVINLLRKEGVCARARLAKLSNLEQATVTNIINDFLEWGLVQEIGFISGDKGRRSIGISINNEGFFRKTSIDAGRKAGQESVAQGSF